MFRGRAFSRSFTVCVSGATHKVERRGIYQPIQRKHRGGIKSRVLETNVCLRSRNKKSGNEPNVRCEGRATSGPPE